MNELDFALQIVETSSQVDFRNEELVKFYNYLNSLHVFEDDFGALSYRNSNDLDPFAILFSGSESLAPIAVEFVDFESRMIELDADISVDVLSTIIHFAIYRIRQDVHSIFQGRYFPFHSIAGRYDLPEFELDVEINSMDFVEAVLEIAEEYNFFLIRGFGFFAFGDSMQDACESFEEIYEYTQK